MHRHADTVAGSTSELAGGRLRWGGGNAALDLLTGGGGPVAPAASPTFPVQLQSSVPQNGPASPITTTSGTSASVRGVQLTIGTFFLLAIGALILLNQVKFRFSTTVG